MKKRRELVASVSEFIRTPPFTDNPSSIRAHLLRNLADLTEFHRDYCEPYGRILKKLFPQYEEPQSLSDIPYIPVQLFKTLTLRSIKPDEIVKTMTSSGTSGVAPSKVYLDRETASLQSKALAQIMSSILGKARVPMLVIDSPSTATDRTEFSARGAGVRGFSMFGRPIMFALDEKMTPHLGAVKEFSALHGQDKVLLFGFTSVVWENLLENLRNHNERVSLPHAILLHGGGWKKLTSMAVSAAEFAESAKTFLGVQRVINYYGMVEQTGSIFLECENHVLHASTYGDVIIRDAITHSPLPHGEEGLIQSISVLPLSYPGHSILTEDKGLILGKDDCPCGRSGTYFRVLGRIKDAEVRGCSDAVAK